jgi:hypothetical protein
LHDFTLKTYRKLLEALINQNYIFTTLDKFYKVNYESKTVLLRHDVDRLPKNAYKIAKLENEVGIQSSYYFRAIPLTFKHKIIEIIAEWEHEIGYHYEDLRFTLGDIDKAYESFKKNLKAFRKIYPITTICMHGSPKSKWDSKLIWQKYDYRKLGIIGEPYFDINFDDVFYLTDTGRRWDGWKVSLRDKVPQQEKWIKQGLVFHSTQDIIKAAKNNQLPDKIMITTHPQRWTDKPLPWVKELVWQNTKNVAKYFLVKLRSNS